MKKILVLQLLVALTLSAFAQGAKFTGIGIFKIGSDTTILTKYAKDNSIEFTIIQSSKNPFVREYLLKEYRLTAITIKSIKLKYYKNALIKFTTDDASGIHNLMDAKYGYGKIDKETKVARCLYTNTGITVDLEEKDYTITWMNGGIKAQYAIWTNYDDDCKKRHFSLFIYYRENKELNDWEYKHRDDETRIDLKDF